jgi:carbonic anhydrase/acetyltransferase-like protein (isoleucine patch superfamily)
MSAIRKLLISPNSSVVPYNNVWPKYPPSLFMACGARLIGNVTCGENVTLWFNTIIRGDVNYIEIGDYTNIQDNTTIHVSYKREATHIGKHVSIAHSCLIHGCDILDYCMIGMNATVMNKARVGPWSIVGAGSLVTEGKVIPEGWLAFGRPAKPIRRLTDAEIKEIEDLSYRYPMYAEGYNFVDLGT